jgi:hypothetical protein
MRPPYEAWNRTTRVAATAAGEKAVVIWNIDTRDWAGASVALITRRALHGGDGAIVLMHTFPHATATALPAIIRGYRARGFRFPTIGQMLGIAGPVPFPWAIVPDPSRYSRGVLTKGLTNRLGWEETSLQTACQDLTGR